MTQLGPLAGVRVVDMATLIAGPEAARHLADFGADVIKVESPGGDSTRRLGWRVPGDSDSLFWKLVGRGKRCVSLDLKSEAGYAEMLRILDGAHVLIENMRPGKLEQLGLEPDLLLERNPRLVIVRVSGFGQTGPYSGHPGFATIAEALSGYANLCGDADGPPHLPPVALTDEVTAIVAAFATVVAVLHAERTGEGQVIDVNLLETMIQLLGPLPSAYVHLGFEQPRMGSGIPYTVPRGTYRCLDGAWVAISSSAESVAQRVMSLLGVGDDERFRSFEGRAGHRDEIEERLTRFVAERSSDEVLRVFREADAAIAPVYSMHEVLADPHVQEREIMIDVDGVRMQAPLARLSRTPAQVSFAGRSFGADTDGVLDDPWREAEPCADPVASATDAAELGGTPTAQ